MPDLMARLNNNNNKNKKNKKQWQPININKISETRKVKDSQINLLKVEV